MNPLEPLLPALRDALLLPPMETADGQPVQVLQYLPLGFADRLYVQLKQPTAVPQQRARECKSWDCTLLLDCVQICAPGFVNADEADRLAGEVDERLTRQELPLPEGWSMSEGRTETINGLDERFDGEQIDVHRYVRMRFTLYEIS